MLFNSSHLSCLCCMINIFRRMKKKIRMELMNRLPHYPLYDGLDEYSLLSYRKLHFIFLLFVHYSMIRFRNFWWSFFLNNFYFSRCFVETSLLIDCRSAGTWVATSPSDHLLAECRGIYIFWWQMFFIFYIASHGAAINFIIWTSSLFFFFRLFLLINSISLFWPLHYLPFTD